MVLGVGGVFAFTPSLTQVQGLGKMCSTEEDYTYRGGSGNLGRMTAIKSFVAAGFLASFVVTQPAEARATKHSTPNISICGSGKRITCVVDGDTIWIDGEKIRLEGFNAPEVSGQCNRERELAQRATRELQAIQAHIGDDQKQSR